MTTIPLAQHAPRPLSLRRNFAWTFAGNVLYAASQWGVLIVLAKLGTTVMVGQFALGLAVTAPIFMFANLQLRTLLATDRRREFQFGEFLGLRLAACVLAMAVVMAIGTMGDFDRRTVWVFAFVGLAKAFESIANTFYGLFQQNERLDRATISAVCHGVLALLALGLGVYLTGDIVWGAVGFAMPRLLVVLMYDIPAGVRFLRSDANVARPRWLTGLACIRPRWNVGQLRRLTLMALPLGFTSLLISLGTNIPRYFVNEIGKYELGIFGPIAALMAAGITLMRALDNASCPRLAKYYTAGQTGEFRTLFAKLMLIYAALGIAGVCVAWFAGRWLLTILFKPEYAQHTDILLTVMFAAMAAYFAGAIHTALITIRCIRSQVPLLLLNTAAAYVACYLLVPMYGLLGAAIALAASRVPFVVVGLLLLIHETRPRTELADSCLSSSC